ncbi:MAG TPA: ABC transporter ATP-binding protein [Acidimicrobiales bacterium]|nr:ABC transporter ATP-binding protein [Acidimicrobiales bacterium]
MERVVSTGVVESTTISLDHVTKVYRGGGGVYDLTLSIRVGEVFGFLGPNGAGKTTTIRLVLDLIRPSSGSIRVFGLDSRSDSVAIRRRLGYLPGELALYERLSAREILTHFAHLRGLVWSDVEHYVQLFDLDVDRPVRALSRGNRQKVGLVAALMGDPDLLVLDEPTSGLDPLVQQQVREEVRRAAHEGRTVLLSSHILSEVGEMADRVGLIREGRLVAIEEVAQMQARSAHLVEAQFKSAPDLAAFASLSGVTSYNVDGSTLHLEVAGDLNPIVALLAKSELEDLSIREPTLEELFLRFYGSTHE